MIWNAQESAPTTRSLIVSRIMAEIDAVREISPAPAGGRRRIEQVAHGVACFIEQQPDGFCLDSKDLLLLTSRALSSAGERGLAGRLLAFRTGLVRQADWLTSASTPMLAVDMKRIAVGQNDCLELAVFESLSAVLDAIADSWNDSSGYGALGLLRIRAAAAALIGSPVRSRKTVRLVGEIRSFCAQKLAEIQRARRWNDKPSVLILDM